MKKHFLDLFSGLGGASQAFVDDINNWVVLRIDNNPLLGGVPFTIIDDVKNVIPRMNLDVNEITNTIDCIWASPPCREFSGGFNSPKSKASREGRLEDYEPDMSLLLSALEIIGIVKPKYWIIENVVGSIRYFEEFLGEPRQIIGPYVLWGNFPMLSINSTTIASKSSKDVHSSDPLRANKKAKVDYAISKGLKDAIETQKSILEF